MFKKLIIVAATTAAIIPAASAADLYAPVAIPNTFTSSGFDWSGFYVGAVGGYVWGRNVGSPSGGVTSTTIDPSGGQIGLTAGVNGQFDQFVLGLEGEVLWSGAKSSGTVTGTANVATIKSDWQGAIKARAGVAFDQVLVYAHGGFAFADHSASVSNNAGFLGEYRTTRSGWTVGAGVEVAVTDNVSAKLEYAYSDFGKWSANHTTLGGTDFQYHNHAIKAGVNFHF